VVGTDARRAQEGEQEEQGMQPPPVLELPVG
jgi:hypothetical protein